MLNLAQRKALCALDGDLKNEEGGSNDREHDLAVDLVRELKKGLDTPPRPDIYGRNWTPFENAALCLLCGQPDEFEDCNHEDIGDAGAEMLGYSKSKDTTPKVETRTEETHRLIGHIEAARSILASPTLGWREHANIPEVRFALGLLKSDIETRLTS